MKKNSKLWKEVPELTVAIDVGEMMATTPKGWPGNHAWMSRSCIRWNCAAPTSSSICCRFGCATVCCGRARCWSIWRGARPKKCACRLLAGITGTFRTRSRQRLLEAAATARPPLSSTIDQLTGRIEESDAQLEQLAREKYPQTQYPPSVAGVGTLAALTYVLTLGAPDRFAKRREAVHRVHHNHSELNRVRMEERLPGSDSRPRRKSPNAVDRAGHLMEEP